MYVSERPNLFFNELFLKSVISIKCKLYFKVNDGECILQLVGCHKIVFLCVTKRIRTI